MLQATDNSCQKSQEKTRFQLSLCGFLCQKQSNMEGDLVGMIMNGISLVDLRSKLICNTEA